MRPSGRVFFPRFLPGILQPHRNRGRRLRPLSFAANGVEGKMEVRNEASSDEHSFDSSPSDWTHGRLHVKYGRVAVEDVDGRQG